MTNKVQPSVEQLYEIVHYLYVDIKDLLMSSRKHLKSTTAVIKKLYNMELLKDKEFKGLFFEITSDGVGEEWQGRFSINLRITNLNDKKKKVEVDANYISVEHGLIDIAYGEPSGIRSGGRFLQANSFVDAKLYFDVIKQSREGDRIELEINDGKIASLLLIKERNQWFIVEEKSQNKTNRDIKKLIEHFDAIDEKFGLVLQNFSVKVEGESSLKLFCEVLALNGEIPEEGFSIEVAIYDTDNNIVYHDSISKYDDEFKGFEVFAFNSINLDIPVDEIGKIRFYPTR